MVTTKDYYGVLGVSERASADEVKTAYRTLALRDHPDRNHGSQQAEERFKDIAEAFYVLGDPTRRAEYDALRAGGGPGVSGAGEGVWPGFDLGEFLRGFGVQWGADPGDLAEVDTDTTATLEITAAQALRGAKIRLRLAGRRTVTVTVPAGLTAGQTLRLARLGGTCPSCRHPGDLLLTVRVR